MFIINPYEQASSRNLSSQIRSHSCLVLLVKLQLHIKCFHFCTGPFYLRSSSSSGVVACTFALDYHTLRHVGQSSLFAVVVPWQLVLHNYVVRIEEAFVKLAFVPFAFVVGKGREWGTLTVAFGENERLAFFQYSGCKWVRKDLRSSRRIVETPSTEKLLCGLPLERLGSYVIAILEEKQVVVIHTVALVHSLVPSDPKI